MQGGPPYRTRIFRSSSFIALYRAYPGTDGLPRAGMNPVTVQFPFRIRRAYNPKWTDRQSEIDGCAGETPPFDIRVTVSSEELFLPCPCCRICRRRARLLRVPFPRLSRTPELP